MRTKNPDQQKLLAILKEGQASKPRTSKKKESIIGRIIGHNMDVRTNTESINASILFDDPRKISEKPRNNFAADSPRESIYR